MLHTICEMPLWDFLRSKDFHFSCAFLTEQGKALTFFILRASSRLTNIYMGLFFENGTVEFVYLLANRASFVLSVHWGAPMCTPCD